MLKLNRQGKNSCMISWGYLAISVTESWVLTRAFMIPLLKANGSLEKIYAIIVTDFWQLSATGPWSVREGRHLLFPHIRVGEGGGHKESFNFVEIRTQIQSLERWRCLEYMKLGNGLRNEGNKGTKNTSLANYRLCMNPKQHTLGWEFLRSGDKQLPGKWKSQEHVQWKPSRAHNNLGYVKNLPCHSE